MATLSRLVGRLVRYFAWVLAWTAAGIIFVWLGVGWIFPFLFERTKAFWEFLMGEEAAHNAVLGIAVLMFAYILAGAADASWRGVYLAPIVGDKVAQDIPNSRIERLVVWLATIEVALIVILVPGAWAALNEIGHWLPESGSPGVLGLVLLLAAAVGTTVFLGDLWVFSWRAKPGHDLGSAAAGTTVTRGSRLRDQPPTSTLASLVSTLTSSAAAPPVATASRPIARRPARGRL